LLQLDTALHQLDSATKTVLCEVGEDHRNIIEHSVSSLTSRMRALETERKRQQMDLIKRHTEWTHYQVCVTHFT